MNWKSRGLMRVGVAGTLVAGSAISWHVADGVEAYDGKNPIMHYGMFMHNVVDGLTGTEAPLGDNSVGFGADVTEAPSPEPTKPKSDRKPTPAPSPTVEKEPSPTPTPTPTPTPEKETDPAKCIANWPLEVRAGQVQQVGVTAEQLNSSASVFDEHYIGGPLLMEGVPGNDISDFQKQQRTIRGLVSVDVEGGIVDRYDGMGMGPLDSQKQVAESEEMTVDDAKAAVVTRGKNLKAIGIDQVYGPVVDIDHGGNALDIDGRIFGKDYETVKEYSVAYGQAWQEAGILATAKHWPGGVGKTNTDHGVSKTRNVSKLGPDMSIYQEMPEGTAIMISNTIVPGLTGGKPASLSRDAVTGVLRNQLEFNGIEDLVVTDALNAEGVIGSTDGMTVARAAVEAIAAGADQALYVATSESLDEQVGKVSRHIVKAVENGEITEEQLNTSVGRVIHAKNINPCEIDLPKTR